MTRFTEDRALWIARNVLPHERALHAQILRWGLPHDLEADDVIQETYSRIASMDSVDGIHNARNYLFTIARNFIVSHVRRARVVSIRAVDNLDMFGIADDDPSPETRASDREQLYILAQAVAELPEPSRSAFLMRVMDELPHGVISKKLGMSENAVQKNIAKSVRLLLTRLGRGGNDSLDASTQQGNTRDAGRRGKARHEHGD